MQPLTTLFLYNSVYSSNGVSSVSNIHNFIELLVTTSAAVPSTVRNLRVELKTPTSVLATWQKPTDEDGVSSYEIVYWKVRKKKKRNTTKKVRMWLFTEKKMTKLGNIIVG